MNKSKTSSASHPSTRTSVASKLAAMANAATEVTSASDGVSVSQLVTELDKQRASLKEDISVLIQESVATLQSSVNTLTETVNSFQARLNATESLAGDNFAALHTADRKIKLQEEQNKTLLDRVDDLENRSRRANLRLLNVPEDSEKGQPVVQFVSEMLMEVMGKDVFDKPPELERAHRTLGQKPRDGQPPCPFVVCFHRFQEKEKALRWARTHDIEFKGVKLRMYPHMSATLAKQRASFKNIKQLLYEKGIWFQLLYPARLRVQLENQTYNFFFTRRSPGVL